MMSGSLNKENGCSTCIFLFITVLVFLFVNCVQCNPIHLCPNDIDPCKCDSTEKSIKCTSAIFLDLKRIFETKQPQSSSQEFIVNEVTIHPPYLRSRMPIESLEEGTFGIIKTRTLNIFRTDLRFIHRNALQSTATYTRHLSLTHNKLSYSIDDYQRRHLFNQSSVENTHLQDLNSREWISQESEGNDYDLFKFLHTMTSLVGLDLSYNEIEMIPVGAFSPLTSLSTLRLNNNRLKVIGANAFYEIPSLYHIDLSYNEIYKMANHSLSFSPTPIGSPSTLEINLRESGLQDETLPVLEVTRRPLKLILTHNHLSLVNEHIFSPLLMKYPTSLIDVTGNPIDCGCRMMWLVRHKHLLQHNFVDFRCQPQFRSIWDLPHDDTCRDNNLKNNIE